MGTLVPAESKKRRVDTPSQEVEPKKNKPLTVEERYSKRLRLVQAVQTSPGYLAYIAVRGQGDRNCDGVPPSPNPCDPNISKRAWEEKCREWKNALRQFGDVTAPSGCA